MLLRQILLPAAILPAVTAAGVWWLAGLRRRSDGDDRSGDRRSAGDAAIGGLALAVAFAASLVASTGWPRWPPVDATERLIFLVGLAAVAALLLGRVPRRARGAATWVARALFGLALTAVLFESLLRNSWTAGQAVAWLGALALAFLALCWALERGLGGEGRVVGWLAPLTRVALLGGAAIVLGLSGSARLALLAGGLAAAVGSIEALALLLGRPAWRPGDAWALAAAVFGLLSIGYFYASLSAGATILLLAALLLLALPARAWWGWLLPLVPLGLALALAISAFLTPEEDPYDYYSALPGPPTQAVALPVAGGPAARGGIGLPGGDWSASSPPKRTPASRRNGNGGRPPIITKT